MYAGNTKDWFKENCSLRSVVTSKRWQQKEQGRAGGDSKLQFQSQLKWHDSTSRGPYISQTFEKVAFEYAILVNTYRPRPPKKERRLLHLPHPPFFSSSSSSFSFRQTMMLWPIFSQVPEEPQEPALPSSFKPSMVTIYSHLHTAG